MGTVHALLTRGQNRGTNGSPVIPKYLYKREGKVAKKGRDFRSIRAIDKFCKKEKTQEKLITLLPGIPEKPLMHIHRFKKNHTLQVLEAEIAI